MIASLHCTPKSPVECSKVARLAIPPGKVHAIKPSLRLQFRASPTLLLILKINSDYIASNAKAHRRMSIFSNLQCLSLGFRKFHEPSIDDRHAPTFCMTLLVLGDRTHAL
jgi:hypothetical protein